MRRAGLSACSKPTSGRQGALADLPLSELLECVAARTPAPGGGSAAAVTCALAAGLVEMAARFAPDGSPAAGVAERAGELRGICLGLAEEDVRAYTPVLEALRLPAAEPDRLKRLAAARWEASQPPLGVAQAGAQVAELGVIAGRSGSPHLIGDAIAGVLLAAAASRAAAELVAINLADAPGDPRRQSAGESAERAAQASLEIFAIRRD
jgi:formiminotetrahydrofolate cyclodeaminase